MNALIYSFLAGISTVLGALLFFVFGSPGKKLLAASLGFAGGVMLAISMFELLPEAVELGSLTGALAGFLLGLTMMYVVDILLPHAHLSKSDDLVVENAHKYSVYKTPVLRTGFLILAGIALHNLPEGLAIGAGVEASPELGLYIAIAIGLHNIPEGLAMAGPLRAGGLSSVRTFLLVLGAGLIMPIGAALGLVLFSISEVFIGGSLAFAAGAMIYIVLDELIPQANAMHGHCAIIGVGAGLLPGFVLL